MLSGFGFGESGGPLQFHHQSGMATDGTNLLVADTRNHRVLIWHTAPTENIPPDIVLGQPNFDSNLSGDGMNELNWPVAVATDGNRILVADTNNHRILIWNSYPTTSGIPADTILETPDLKKGDRGDINWPWAVWTDGKKMIVASTAGSQVLIWDSIPSTNNETPDIALQLDNFGTPRTIASDGTHLLISDHNAKDGHQGSFFWNTFPTKDNEQYDFFVADPDDMGVQNTSQNKGTHGLVLWGPTTLPGGGLASVTNHGAYLWETWPEDEHDAPNMMLGTNHEGEGYNYGLSGDGSSVLAIGERLYFSLANSNKIVGLHAIPNVSTKEPDFVIGSPDQDINTLESNAIITNGVPISNGQELIVSSDFDRALYIWNTLPEVSGTHPDVRINLREAPWDNTLHNDTLLLGGRDTIYMWEGIPTDGRDPDVEWVKSFGSVELQSINGIALDDSYLYVADTEASVVYVFDGIPKEGESPVFILPADRPGRITSDGEYLVVMNGPNAGGLITVFKVNDLDGHQYTFGREETYHFNLASHALVTDGSLIVADTGYNRVHIWHDIEDALIGNAADTLLGETKILSTPEDARPANGPSNMYMPGAISWDGIHLWVGEFKFSSRILRFTAKE